jgi:hypothetical protein
MTAISQTGHIEQVIVLVETSTCRAAYRILPVMHEESAEIPFVDALTILPD